MTPNVPGVDMITEGIGPECTVPLAGSEAFEHRQVAPVEEPVSTPNLPNAQARSLLSSYEIGRKLRKLRMRKKMALTSLSKCAGLSSSMLSLLENGKVVPTLPTLARLATVFDVGIDFFFVTRSDRHLFTVSQPHERIRLCGQPESKRPSYFFECLTSSILNAGVQALLMEFPFRHEEEAPEEHSHAGMELLYLLEGDLEITYRGDPHVIKAGYSACFDSSEPHAYRGLSPHRALGLVITSANRV